MGLRRPLRRRPRQSPGRQCHCGCHHLSGEAMHPARPSGHRRECIDIVYMEAPIFAAERRAERCQDIVTDFCQHGARWRKRTIFLAWSLLRAPPDMCQQCSGRGVCSRTGQPHIVLRGCVPGSSLPWTLRAQPNLTDLARRLASWLVRGSERLSYATIASAVA